jgi:hypothetical protein
MSVNPPSEEGSRGHQKWRSTRNLVLRRRNLLLDEVNWVLRAPKLRKSEF